MEAKEKPKQSRLKKAIMAITAGIMLMNAMPAFAEQPKEMPFDEQKSAEFKKQMDEYEAEKFQKDAQEWHEHRREDIRIDSAAKEVMDSLGFQVLGNIFYYGGTGDKEKLITFDNNTKKVNIGLDRDGNIRIIVEDYDGKIVFVIVDRGSNVKIHERGAR